MKVDAPCPECDHTPVDVLTMVDGKVWICPNCRHHELEGSANLDAAIETLGCHDPELVASWREALGLPPVRSNDSMNN